MAKRNWIWASYDDPDGEIQFWPGAVEPTRELDYPLEVEEEQVERLLKGDRTVLNELAGTWSGADEALVNPCSAGFRQVFPTLFKVLKQAGKLKVEFKVSETKFTGAIELWEWENPEDGYGYLGASKPHKQEHTNHLAGNGDAVVFTDELRELLGVDKSGPGSARPLYLQLKPYTAAAKPHARAKR